METVSLDEVSFDCNCSIVFVKTDDGEDDLKKGTQLLEIYALEIQMYTAQKNNKKLKALYEQSLHIKSAIPHPLIMGVIRGNSSSNVYRLSQKSPYIGENVTLFTKYPLHGCHFFVNTHTESSLLLMMNWCYACNCMSVATFLTAS